MSDICVWARNYRRIYGYLGFSELEWLDGSVNLRRFKLGRLQYNFGHFEASDDHDISLDIPNGSRMIEIHIQQDGPFDDEICGRSLKMAEEFFKKHYPNEDFRGFICHSWLLSPTLSAVLDETSNIIKFGERFTIVKHEVENDKQAIERIFGEKFKDKDFKPTSLQIKARKHLDEGGHLGNALGVILF